MYLFIYLFFIHIFFFWGGNILFLCYTSSKRGRIFFLLYSNCHEVQQSQDPEAWSTMDRETIKLAFRNSNVPVKLLQFSERSLPPDLTENTHFPRISSNVQFAGVSQKIDTKTETKTASSSIKFAVAAISSSCDFVGHMTRISPPLTPSTNFVMWFRCSSGKEAFSGSDRFAT